jgi:hypothetical protein
MSQRQQDIGLALCRFLRLQHFAKHGTPGFVVPN